MKKFKLKTPGYTFDHRGMIIQGELRSEGHIIDACAGDICSDNMNIMSKMDIKDCMEYGSDSTWNYELDRLEPLESIKVTSLDYEMLKFLKKQGAKYICRDKNGLLNLYENEPHIMNDSRTWMASGGYGYLANFASQLFQFVTWKSQKYYVIEDVLENCEIVED